MFVHLSVSTVWDRTQNLQPNITTQSFIKPSASHSHKIIFVWTCHILFLLQYPLFIKSTRQISAFKRDLLFDNTLFDYQCFSFWKEAEMEGEGCQPTASDPSEIFATGSVKVRLPSVASMTGSVFIESHHVEARKEAAYRQESQSLGPATTPAVISAPKRGSGKFNIWYLLS